jgi:hypothetical protein
MSAKAIGMSNKDCRLYYVGQHLAVMDDPVSGGATIVKRQPGDPDRAEVQDVLARLGMKLAGTPSYREDGLWFCKVTEGKEVKA